MTATPLDPRMAQMQRSAQDAQDGVLKIDALKKNLTPPKDKEKKLREACEGFESIFIQKMWEQMRATVPKSGLLKGREEQFWQGMFDQELSKKMSSSGGIGLADMMYDQLSRSLVSATRTTASDTTRKGEGFSITAAPLIPQAAPGGVQATAEARSVNRAQPAGAVQSVYTGEAVQPEAVDAPTQPIAQPVARKAADTATGAGAPAAATPASGQAAAAEQGPAATSPIVEQFLAELRSRQTAEAQSAPPAAQPAVPAQNVAPGAVAAVPQQAGVQQPNPVAMAQNVLQTAGSRMPAGGVLPPMTPVQRQPRVDRYQPTPNARQAGDRTQATTETPAVSQASQATSAGAGSPAAATTPAAAQQVAATPVPAAPASPPAPAGPQGLGAAQENPAAPQAPQVVHSTFTTNVPPGRSGRRRPPRVPKGQALNRMPTAANAPQTQQPVQPRQAQPIPAPGQQPAAAVSAAAVPRTDGGTPNTAAPQG